MYSRELRPNMVLGCFLDLSTLPNSSKQSFLEVRQKDPTSQVLHNYSDVTAQDLGTLQNLVSLLAYRNMIETNVSNWAATVT
ncbi:disease resistance protein RUN1 [Trifolium repens]|nr:disease resistance protein RUN1 [Trifolium repens]